jgi:hypothetical protein
MVPSKPQEKKFMRPQIKGKKLAVVACHSRKSKKKVRLPCRQA